MVLCVYLPLANKLLQLEIEDGDKINFFTEQLGGRDDIQHNGDGALEQMEACHDIQAPYDVAQDQSGFVENYQPGSHIAAYSPAGNAEFEGRNENWNAHAERSTTQEKVGLKYNVAANDTPTSNQLGNETDNLSSNGNANGEKREGAQHIQSDENISDARPDRAQTIPADISVAASLQAPEALRNIKIRVIDSNSLNELEFKIGMNTLMEKLIRHVCMRWGISERTVRFTFLGNRLQKDETPSIVSNSGPHAGRQEFYERSVILISTS